MPGAAERNGAVPTLANSLTCMIGRWQAFDEISEGDDSFPVMTEAANLPNSSQTLGPRILKQLEARVPLGGMAEREFMTTESVTHRNSIHAARVSQKYLESPDDEHFADFFHAFTPRLVAFFRVRGCPLSLAEDLTQDVMLTVHLKASQVRDRALFRAWLFRVARNAMCRHFKKYARDLETVDLQSVIDITPSNTSALGGTPAFEFREWLSFLDAKEREVMSLRCIEDWEYHEIAAAQSAPIGTIQWRVHNAKRKLALHLRAVRTTAGVTNPSSESDN
jgi:RNA polymerase sigma-70 factor, ECF subfamily